LRRNERALRRSWFSNIRIIIYWFFSCAFYAGPKSILYFFTFCAGKWLFNARGLL
jgi:hypothetical protein